MLRHLLSRVFSLVNRAAQVAQVAALGLAAGLLAVTGLGAAMLAAGVAALGLAAVMAVVLPRSRGLHARLPINSAAPIHGHGTWPRGQLGRGNAFGPWRRGGPVTPGGTSGSVFRFLGESDALS